MSLGRKFSSILFFLVLRLTLKKDQENFDGKLIRNFCTALLNCSFSHSKKSIIKSSKKLDKLFKSILQSKINVMKWLKEISLQIDSIWIDFQHEKTIEILLHKFLMFQRWREKSNFKLHKMKRGNLKFYYRKFCINLPP